MSLCLVFTEDGELELLDELENRGLEGHSRQSNNNGYATWSSSWNIEHGCLGELKQWPAAHDSAASVAGRRILTVRKPNAVGKENEVRGMGKAVTTTGKSLLDSIPADLIVSHLLPALARSERVPKSLARFSALGRVCRTLARRAWPALFPIVFGFELPAVLRRFTLVLPTIVCDVMLGRLLVCPNCESALREKYVPACQRSGYVSSELHCVGECGFRARCPRDLRGAVGSATTSASESPSLLTSESLPFAVLAPGQFGVRGLHLCPSCDGCVRHNSETPMCGNCDKSARNNDMTDEGRIVKAKCRYMQRKGFCPYGDGCWFSHG